jgi:hypothetical protein
MRFNALRFISAIGATAILGAALPGPAGADEPYRTEETRLEASIPVNYKELMKMQPMDVMHAIDNQKKGVVTKEQFLKYHSMLFDKMDKDHNGELSQSEWMGR